MHTNSKSSSENLIQNVKNMTQPGTRGTKKPKLNRGSIPKLIAAGDYDNIIISNYRSMRIDLKKSVSGANWGDQYSSYRILAKNLGLDPDDDKIVRELYRVVMYNKRFIRDRLASKDMSLSSKKKITEVNIVIPNPVYKRPPELKKKPEKIYENIPENIPDIPENIPKDITEVIPKDIPTKIPEDVHEVTPRQSTRSKKHHHPPLSAHYGPQPLAEVDVVSWSSFSIVKTCPRCHHTGQTKIHFRIGTCTWSWVIGLILTGFCLPCSWFPCALNCTKDTLHICRECLYILGRVPRNPCGKKSIDDLKAPTIIINDNEQFDKMIFTNK